MTNEIGRAEVERELPAQLKKVAHHSDLASRRLQELASTRLGSGPLSADEAAEVAAGAMRYVDNIDEAMAGLDELLEEMTPDEVSRVQTAATLARVVRIALANELSLHLS